MGGPLTEDGLENSNFQAVFFDFLKEFVCDEQTFIEVKQHPQAGPETTHIMCVKYENFFKNQFCAAVLRPSGGAASVCLLSMMFLVGASRLSSLYLRFICFSPDVRCHGIRGAQAWVSIL